VIERQLRDESFRGLAQDTPRQTTNQIRSVGFRVNLQGLKSLPACHSSGRTRSTGGATGQPASAYLTNQALKQWGTALIWLWIASGADQLNPSHSLGSGATAPS